MSQDNSNDPYILLVEDSADDELLTLRALRKNCITNRVVVARDGVEAVDYLFGTGTHAGRDTSHVPQLILLDLNLPGMHGLEVLRKIRTHPSTQMIPIVVLSSSGEDSDISLSYELGANSYVRKPVDFTEFVEAAYHLGKYWLTLNQPPPERPRM